MPEIRQNIATKEWVIIASERARRPEDYARGKTIPERAAPSYSPTCPFCRGNERQTPPEVFSLRDDAGWQVRVTRNKYPALDDAGEKEHFFDGVRHWMNGVGIHEVIIESPQHNVTTALLPHEHIARIIHTYRHRSIAALQDKRIEMVTIFKNHGQSAGTSLEHPHSQLIATPIVPLQVRHRISEAMNYFDEHGECVFCRLIRDEIACGERVVVNTVHFVALVVYAARVPFHLWILPKNHCASFPEISDEEISDLSINLKEILMRFFHGLSNPDFNYVIHSLPGHVRKNEFFHWRISVVPRLVETAGFELGSGMYINTSVPEESAAFLRNAAIPSCAGCR